VSVDSVEVLCRECGRVVARMTWTDGTLSVGTWQKLVGRPAPHYSESTSPPGGGAWCGRCEKAVPVAWPEVIAARRLGQRRRVRFAPGRIKPGPWRTTRDW
jgi:hypothetical protein